MGTDKKNKEGFNKLKINRHNGRVCAFQILYSFDINQISKDDFLSNQSELDELFACSWEDEKPTEETIDYAKYLVEGTLRNLTEVDNVISTKLRNWELGRISAIDKAVLRFATFSLMFENDLDANVVIDEAIEIVKKYGAKDSYKFVNGILDAIKKDKKQS